jgi:transcriptional regulator
MYLPEAFRVSDESALRDFIHAHSFGQLITARNNLPQASAIPWVLLGGTLQGHLARANPQAAHIENGTAALAVFSGAHAFVSSTCYDPPSGIATWNYLTVHVTGTLKPIDSEAALWEHLDALTALHEPATRLDELHTAARKKGGLLPHILGFELCIEQMEGKFKLSQNRSSDDRERIICELETRDDPFAHGIARAMRSLQQ